ncbi:MAG: sensor domain-containing diguanylate cyclase [Clostridia bacterium]|nr:sensor domain-containing diguanylate cyclase [Clostridia bacterium]
MYHGTVNISILSKTHNLENWLLIQPVQDPSEYRFCTYDTLSASVIAESDIIICDLPYDKNTFRLQAHPLKKDSMFIFCALPEAMKELSSDEYALFDDIWPQPLHQELAAYYFSKTMEKYKQSKNLHLNKKYLDSLINALPDMIWFKDLSGKHLKVNDSFCRAVGKPKENVTGQYHYYIWDIPKEEYEAGDYVCLDTDEIVLREKKTCMFHENVKIKNSMRQLITYKAPILSDGGESIGTLGCARDVTDWVNMKAELEVVLEHFPFSLLFLDINGIVLSVNIVFENYFNVQRKDIIGGKYEKWASSVFLDYRENFDENYSEASVIIDTQKKLLKISKEPVYDVFNNTTGYFYFFLDVTLEHSIKEKLIHIANTDALTSLYNRRYLFEITEYLRNRYELCLIYIDLDNFKLVNDRFGHIEGDRALIETAQNLSAQFPGEMIFRIGGDEFLVAITTAQSRQMIINKAKSFIDCFHDKTSSMYQFPDLSTSIGIVFDTDSSIDFEKLLQRGDTALYKAKQNGKNQYYIWPA